MKTHGVGTPLEARAPRVPSHESEHATPHTDALTTRLAPKTGDDGIPPGNAIESTAQRGVIRNLIEGHFSGVADVRLRINFADEIAALEQGAAADGAKAAAVTIDTLATAAAQRLDEFVASGGLSESQALALAEIGSDFASAAQSLSAGLAENTVVPADVLDQLRAAFDGMAASLVELFKPADPEAEAPPAQTDLGADLVTDLSSLFETAFAEIQSALAPTSVLPEISPPHGNGRAFEKFLAIYDSIRTPETPDPPDSGSTTGFDATA